MSRFLRHPALAVLILATAALRPILQPHLPCTDDIAFHLLRLTQLDALLRHGVLFSRWAPDMAQGYGYPIFNFYAPLSYYAAELVSLVAGNLNLGIRLTLALGMVGAGWMMYRLARDHMRPLAALTAAVAYLYAPYHAYDILFRGNLAESFAWWLLPLALWCMGRLVRHGGWRWSAATAASYAAVILTHNVFALIFSPVLAAYGLWVWWGERGNKNPQSPNLPISHSLTPLLTALPLGLLLSAFFWYPALAERPLIHTERLLEPPIFVYWGNYLNLYELLLRPRLITPDLINPSPMRGLGLVWALLALPALALVWRTKRQRWVALFFVLATLLTGWLTLSSSGWVWANVPLLEFVQFPWRWLGVGALTTAVLIGFTAEGLLAHWPTGGQGVVLVSIAALMLADGYWLNPRYCPGLANPTVADIAEFEQMTQTIGTTAKGEYVPLTSAEFPAAPATQQFRAHPQAEIASQSRTPLVLTAALTAAAPFTLTAELFAYPGWVASVDGQPVAISPSVPHGLVTLPVPAGAHTVEVRWRETAARQVVNVLSAVGLLVVVGMAVVGKGARRAESGGQDAPVRGWQIGALTAVALAAMLLIHDIPSPVRHAWLPTRPLIPPTALYANGMQAFDVNFPSRTMLADGQMPIVVMWQATRPPTANYQTFIRLVDRNGRVWSPGESIRPRFYRPFYDPRAWPLDQYAEDFHMITALPGTPPGTYSVELVLFDRETLAAVPLVTGELSVVLGTVALQRPPRPWAVAPRFPAGLDGGEIRLLGYEPDRTEANAGDPFAMTLFWQAAEPPTANHTAELLLMDEEIVVWQTPIPVGTASFLPPAWQAGDVWRGQHVFHLPASLPTGLYTWQVRYCAAGVCTAAAPHASLSQLSLTAPAHSFDQPPVAHPVGERLALVGVLVGGNLPATVTAGAPTAVELVWQAIAETNTSYKVFVQLLDEAGQVVAQSDAEPAGWSRPTTSWVQGEFVRDEHTLMAPATPGRYQLIAGLYDPLTAVRLTTPTGENVLLVGEVVVGE